MSQPTTQALPRPVFLDAHSPPRSWTIRITMAHVRDIQQVYPDFRLERILVPDSEETRRIGEDSVLLCQVLEILLADQLAARQMTFEDLLQDYTGETGNGAFIALTSAVANFSPSRVAKEQARRILTAYQALIDLDQQAGEALATISGMPSGSLPAVPESSPGDTASENSANTLTPLPGGELPLSESIWVPEPYPLPAHPATSTP